MSDQHEPTTSPPPAKKLRFQQGQLKGTKKLFTKSKFPDVHFSFVSDDGTIVRVPAHKNLLAGESDVFEAMFYGELKENGDVAITDASAAAFKEFLQFFYLSEGDLSSDLIASVLYLGHKYNVEKCIEACVEHLMENLTDENVCAALSLAIIYDHDELVENCAKRIRTNTDAVLQSVSFMECSKEALAYILQMNLLSCSEVNVFEACMSWIRAKSKQNTVSKAMFKKHLGDLYYEIRFASMTIQEFCALDAKYKAVLSSDFNTIIRIISKAQLGPSRFNNAPRQINWNEDAIVECDRELGQSLRFNLFKDVYDTFFSSNKPLLMGSFECAQIGVSNDRHLDANIFMPTDVTIAELRTLNGDDDDSDDDDDDDEDGKILWSSQIQLESNDTPTVLLPQPIFIRPEFFYRIRIGPVPRRYRFYSAYLEQKVRLDSDTIVKFYDDKYDGYVSKNIGLIPKLNFNRI